METISSIHRVIWLRALNFLRTGHHLVQNRNDHIKRRSFSRVFVHANSNEFGQVWRNSRWYAHAKVLQCDLKKKQPQVSVFPHKTLRCAKTTKHLHPALHGREIGERHFARGQFPQKNRETPHVASFEVDLVGLLAKGLRGHPSGFVYPPNLLERELGVGHVDPGGEVFVDHDVFAGKYNFDFENEHIDTSILQW